MIMMLAKDGDSELKMLFKSTSGSLYTVNVTGKGKVIAMKEVDGVVRSVITKARRVLADDIVHALEHLMHPALPLFSSVLSAI